MTISHYTEQEVQKLLEQHGIPDKAFREFINGQTCPIIQDALCYFRWDVDRFLKAYTKGVQHESSGNRHRG